jgi:peptidoglycan L-alanyl-D-glutamate endopeptidase CwlK
MPMFSQSSLSKLSTCHLDLQRIFFEVVKTYDCVILEGYRDKEGQDKAFLEGKTKLQWPNGNHNVNPSIAVDVAPYPIDWNDSKRFYYFAGFVFGIAYTLKLERKIYYGLRWGGDWNGNRDFSDQSFNDLVHFELIGV